MVKQGGRHGTAISTGIGVNKPESIFHFESQHLGNSYAGVTLTERGGYVEAHYIIIHGIYFSELPQDHKEPYLSGKESVTMFCIDSLFGM